MIKRIYPIIRVAKGEGEIRRLMNEVLSERREFPELEAGWVPPIDVYEKDDELIVEAEVPGLSAGEIVVALQMSRIVIKGIKRETAPAGRPHYLRLEREYGKFRRMVPLPCSVHPERAKAYLENGILSVRMKKWEESGDKEIVVKIRKSQD